MGQKRRRRKKKELTPIQKLERRQQVLADLRAKFGDTFIYIGDCYRCYMPITYPVPTFPDLASLQWDEEGLAIEHRKQIFCVECLPVAASRYVQAIREGIRITGTHASHRELDTEAPS